jgi:hypothetical protein
MFERWKRRNHEATFTETIAEVNHFKSLISQTPCSACTQKQLQLSKFVRNPQGWACEVKCLNCNFMGVVNSEGFDFNQVSSKGKAVDKK